MKNPFIFAIATMLLVGCHTPQRVITRDRIIADAQQNGFMREEITTSTFVITVFRKSRESRESRDIHVYIEGDGHSWKTRYTLSHNPTPHNPLALALAMRDPHPHVVYIARPCQYTALNKDKRCHARYWSSHRYAPEVITAVMDVLDTVAPSRRITLIGFSGGGAVATLVAAQRKDVVALMTVAGDLNHVALNDYHHTSPLTGSLNPADVAHQLGDLKQCHLSGGRDTVVPSWISERFCRQVIAQTGYAGACSVTLPNASHHEGWVEHWPDILKKQAYCINTL